MEWIRSGGKSKSSSGSYSHLSLSSAGVVAVVAEGVEGAAVVVSGASDILMQYVLLCLLCDECLVLGGETD